MGRSLVHLQRVGQSAVIITRIRDTANDGDGNLLDAERTIQAVNGANQSGGIAAGQLQIILAESLLIVGIAVEEDVRDGILLAALEDRLHAIFVIVVFLVLRADAARCGIQHDINLLAQIREAARHRNILCLECRLIGAVNQIQVILHAVCADHVSLTQRLKGKSRGKIRNSDQLHVSLHCNAVCQTLSDGSVTCNTNFDFRHNVLLFLHWLYVK